MASNHSLYKKPSKMVKADALQKTMSKMQRKINKISNEKNKYGKMLCVKKVKEFITGRYLSKLIERKPEFKEDLVILFKKLKQVKYNKNISKMTSKQIKELLLKQEQNNEKSKE